MDDGEFPIDDPQYVSMVEIGFPVPYGEPFFQEFTMDNWFKIKGVLKDMKRRRGKKGVKTYFKFAGFTGGKAPLIFPMLSKGDRQYEMGMEKLEYLVDIVPLQLKTMPPNTEEVLYSFDEVSYKWGPGTALVGGINYIYKNDEWKLPKRSV